MSTGKNRKKSGVILVMTMFMILMISTLIIAYFFVINSEIRILENDLYLIEAKYTAEAGIESALWQLKSNPNWNTGFADQEFPPASGKYFTVTVANAYPKVTLVSKGEVRTRSFEKGIRAEVMVQANPAKIRVDSWTEL